MSKLTYAQQLAHPLWQRRRLTMLDAAGWKCSVCGGHDSQLHVHHRQYFKGRMAWEYSDAELQVLCKNCHERLHVVDDQIKAILCRVPPHEALALLAGYFAGMDDQTAQTVYAQHGDIVELGELASCLRSQSKEFRSNLWDRIVDADMKEAGISVGALGAVVTP